MGMRLQLRSSSAAWVIGLLGSLFGSLLGSALDAPWSDLPGVGQAHAARGNVHYTQRGALGQPAASHPQVASGAEVLSAPDAQLPAGTTVLHIGDSFAGALGPELNRRLSEHGVRGVLKQEKATYIPTWARHQELPRYLSRYRPDLILVTLGANELDIVEPHKRAKTVKRLVGRFGDVPCVWVGIPLWKGANPTLLGIIEANVAPCLYLDSTALVPELERTKDGIHPTSSAKKLWADAVIRWLIQQRRADGARAWSWKSDPPGQLR
jgi:lysophospholipase L1-like esterase